MSRPALSFVVIAYNEGKNIARTLRAIVAQDGLRDYEVVVVNDGSVDNTLTVVQAIAKNNPAVRIVDLQPNKGRGAARDAGIRAAAGTYIAFVDADIVLPANWLRTCMAHLHEHQLDACGGTAVPDGDVSFVHRVCGLKPKVTAHTTAVTGSNGLFRAAVFSKISFDPNKRNGEDVDLGFQLKKHRIRTATVPGLLVEHYETKTFAESMGWLLESGIGASRQLYEHPRLRLPDISFFGVLGLAVAGAFAAWLGTIPLWLPAVAVCGAVTAVSALHLHGKFQLAHRPARALSALLINDLLLGSYYVGRFIGLCTEWRKR